MHTETLHSPAPDAVSDACKTTTMSKIQAVLSSKWLAAALTLGLLWALHQVAPWSEWRAAFAQASPLWLLAAVALVVPHEAIRVLRMEGLVPALARHRLAHGNIVFATACVGQLPVGTIGGDVYRVCRLDELGIPAAQSTAATFLIRIVGFSNTLLLAGVSGAVVLGEAWPLLGALASGLVLFTLATAREPSTHGLGALIRAIKPDATPKDVSGTLAKTVARFRRLLAKTLDHAKDVSRPQLAKLFGWSLLMFTVKTAILWCCLAAIGLDVGLFAAFAALCVGILACAIPSPAGSVGLREGGMVGVLTLLGTAAAPATIAALLYRAAIVAGAGLGLAATSLMVSRASPATA